MATEMNMEITYCDECPVRGDMPPNYCNHPKVQEYQWERRTTLKRTLAPFWCPCRGLDYLVITYRIEGDPEV